MKMFNGILVIFTTPLLLVVAVQALAQPPRVLTCHCNECPEDNCITSPHRDSTCFKSVERQIENNTYVWVQRFGCLSGSDSDLSSLQCNVNNLRHKEPLLMTCCDNNDYCNRDLPDPDESDDPRWAVSQPPQQEQDINNVHRGPLWPVILLTILLTCLGAIIFSLMYKFSAFIYSRLKEKKENLDSVNSIRSFVFDETLKNQFANHHPVESISDSDRTYTMSDKLSPDPHYHYDNSLAITENTATQADFTSGVGARILEPRTMARVVNMGAIEPVGCGRFGRVFKGTYNDKDVAVKAFQPIDRESWEREAKILSLLNHENIVRYMASEMYTVAPSNATETWMFLEFCPFGSLCDFLDKNEICGSQQAIKILYSIIEGLNYLHEDYSTGGGKPPIAHRDIKSKNILMRRPDVCCLADFGHAVIKVNDETLDFGDYGCHRLQVGTVRYLAPEILKPTRALDITQFHTFAQADLYQFSLVLWEVCNRTTLDVLHPVQSHRLPYDDVVPQNPDLADMIKIVCDDNYRPARSPNWQRYPEMGVLSLLMEECWRANPKARMETLGVRKRIKSLFNQIPPPAMYYQNNLLDNALLSPNFEKTKISDMTL